jgi:predicted metal-dependent TIM-barrel fold hydrolase
LLDDAGRWVPEALEVLALAAEHDVLVATGHLSGGEVTELQRCASAAGVRRFLVQHPCFTVPALSAEALQPLVHAGATVELTYLSISPLWQTSTIAEAAALLRRFGGERVVLSGDAGQAHSPAPPDALGAFAQSLYEDGVPEAELRYALVDTPARLLD